MQKVSRIKDGFSWEDVEQSNLLKPSKNLIKPPDSEPGGDRIPDPHDEAVRERFRHVDLDHPVMMELLELVSQPAHTNEVHHPEYKLKAENPVLSKEEFREQVKILLKNVKLPALPQIFPQLQKVINDPESSATDLAKIISLDPSLSACLLRIVNSPFYGFPSKIDTITKAVTVLGSRQIYTLAMGAMVLDLFKGSVKALDMGLFWKHSIGCAVIARALAAECERKERERYFVAGLLHDIGRLVLFQTMPDLAAEVMRHAISTKATLYQTERKLLGFDHGRLGAVLLQKWGFPPSLIDAVLYHHLPGKSEKHDEPGFVHLADVITRALGIGSSGDFYVPPLDRQVWEKLGLYPNRLSQLLGGLDEELKLTFEILSHA